MNRWLKKTSISFAFTEADFEANIDKKSIFCKICQQDYAISKLKSSWKIWNFVDHLKARHALETGTSISNMTEEVENTQLDSHSPEEARPSVSNIEAENAQVYVQELKSYLLLNNCPLEVSLSADATSLIPKVEYNVKLNSMIGFSLPVKENGLPGAEESICDGVARIINAFDKLDKATNVLIIMAQPMSDAVPPMRICSFGTNNKYTAVDVHNRLSTISAALTEVGIRILTYSADGDTRELKMMRTLMKLGTSAGTFY